MQVSAQKNSEKLVLDPGSGSVWLFFRNTAIFLSWLIGFVICIRLVLVRSYNYDEIGHTHMAWLLSVGEVPYRDFAINHLPFFWVILSPLLQALPHAPVTLVLLRLGALLLNVVFVTSVGALICINLKPSQRIWAAAFFGLFVANPLVAHYLIELRPDALANALLFTSIAWLHSGSRKPFVGMIIAGFFIGAGVLLYTKYLLFPSFLAATSLLRHAYKTNRLHPMTWCIFLGLSIAAGVGVITLCIYQVSFQEAWRMAVTYNAAVEKMRPFGFGAATSLTASPFLLLLSILGILGYSFSVIRRKIRPGPYEVAVLVFLLIFLFTTTRPWKQYAVSWFLLAALFPSSLAAMLMAQFTPKTQFFTASGILAITILGFTHSDLSDPNATGGISRKDQDDLIRFCSQHLAPSDAVVAGYALHPVFWPDSFFKANIDMQPGGVDGFEKIMPTLFAPKHKERWELAGYERELEERPPSLIVMPTLITEAQRHALSGYLERHGGDYQHCTIPNTPVTALLRRSQAQ